MRRLLIFAGLLIAGIVGAQSLVQQHNGYHRFDIADATTLKVGGTALTATAAELNYLDLTTLGTSENSKVASYSATGEHTVASGDTITIASGGVFNHASGGTLILHGLTLTSGEIGALDGITLGTSLDSKAATYSASGKHTVAATDTIDFASSSVLQIAGESVTASAAEINYNDVTTLGTSQDSKVATYSATGKHTVASADTVNFASGGVLQLDGTSVTASATEINYVDGFQAVSTVFSADANLCTLAVPGLTSTSQIVGLYAINADSGYGVSLHFHSADSVFVRRPTDEGLVAADTVRALFVPNF